MVGPKSNLAGRTIEDVVITIPFPKAVQVPSPIPGPARPGPG